MPRAAHRYDFCLPLKFNDGRRIPSKILDSIEDRLLKHFDGLTSQTRDFPLKGLWRERMKVYHDQIVLMTAVDLRPAGSARFVSKLKEVLLRELRQLEILITESPLRVH